MLYVFTDIFTNHPEKTPSQDEYLTKKVQNHIEIGMNASMQNVTNPMQNYEILKKSASI
jgi:hypothetical protein